MRHFNFTDKLCISIDNALKTIVGPPIGTGRTNPAAGVAESPSIDKARSAYLMRINHTGEVCAQALYQGQALTARSPEIAKTMQHAAEEENDHLLWCAARLKALDSRPSYLNPFWYAGSFTLGTIAGIAGDRWNLGFLAETEKQVVNHLDKQLEKLPEDDAKSRAIVMQMKSDEAAHESLANAQGAYTLPAWMQWSMTSMSLVMKSCVRWV